MPQGSALHSHRPEDGGKFVPMPLYVPHHGGVLTRWEPGWGWGTQSLSAETFLVPVGNRTGMLPPFSS
jgi:hypothetical protein